MTNFQMVSLAMMVAGTITAVIGDQLAGEITKDLGVYCTLFGILGIMIGGVPR